MKIRKIQKINTLNFSTIMIVNVIHELIIVLIVLYYVNAQSICNEKCEMPSTNIIVQPSSTGKISPIQQQTSSERMDTLSRNIVSDSSSDLKKEHQSSPLNIVLILVDDLGWNDLGSYNNPDPKKYFSPLTPNIDAIIKNEKGIKLKQMHVWPVCSPTRAALLTGRYPVRMGANSFVANAAYKFWIPANETLISNVLKSHFNYKTHAVGKWVRKFYSP